MKNAFSKTAAAILLSSAALLPAMAQAELSANAGVTSNYLWRGMEQTDGGPAIQGGLDYSNESGFYAGTWASNVDFGDDADFEIDLYLGYGGAMGDWEYDVGYILYMYPGTDEDIDAGEFYANFSLNSLTLGFATLAHADGADFADTLYFSADYGIALPNDFELSLHIGHGSSDGGEDAIDFGASVAKSGFTLGLSKFNQDGAGDDAEEIKLYVSYSMDFEL